MDKLNKTIIAMICIIAILISILSAIIIYKPDNQQEAQEKVETEISETILDECTDDYENMKNEIIETNSEQEKISPNCKITLEKYYKSCEDTINEYLQVPNNLVNCTEQELQDQYKDWEIKEFSSNQIVLYREFDEECGEHYILRDDEGKISIYKILENGEEVLYENTEISTEYLPQRDKDSIKEGLKVNGIEKLNEIIESFE